MHPDQVAVAVLDVEELRWGYVARSDVQGAPLWVGAQVFIEASALDGTADERFADHVGVVTGYLYDCPEQHPHHPLLLVSVETLGEDVFFAKELRLRDARQVSAREPMTAAR